MKHRLSHVVILIDIHTNINTNEGSIKGKEVPEDSEDRQGQQDRLGQWVYLELLDLLEQQAQKVRWGRQELQVLQGQERRVRQGQLGQE